MNAHATLPNTKAEHTKDCVTLLNNFVKRSNWKRYAKKKINNIDHRLFMTKDDPLVFIVTYDPTTNTTALYDLSLPKLNAKYLYVPARSEEGNVYVTVCEKEFWKTNRHIADSIPEEMYKSIKAHGGFESMESVFEPAPDLAIHFLYNLANDNNWTIAPDLFQWLHSLDKCEP